MGWVYDGELSWSRESSIPGCDWRITVTAAGRFVVDDTEIVLATAKEGVLQVGEAMVFPTLARAQRWCERQDQCLSPNQDRVVNAAAEELPQTSPERLCE